MTRTVMTNNSSNTEENSLFLLIYFMTVIIRWIHCFIRISTCYFIINTSCCFYIPVGQEVQTRFYQHECGRACQLELMLDSSAVSHLLARCQQPAEQSTEPNNSARQIMHSLMGSFSLCDQRLAHNASIRRINK